MSSTYLAVLDFDHTIIDGNSDDIVAKLLPPEILSADSLKKKRKNEGWICYMTEIFQLLPKYGFTKKKLEKICGEFKPTPGILPLLQFLESFPIDFIILSDSNHFMISTWLRANNFEKVPIFTNPATWNNDTLLLEPYHNQNECPDCSKNLCKGSVLREYLRSRGSYTKIFYIGDGQNDFCPSKLLSKTDYVFPRINFKLDNLLKKYKIEAQIIAWDTANDILKKITEICR